MCSRASVVCVGDIWRWRGLEANGIIVRMVGRNLSTVSRAVGNGSLWEWEETRYLPTRVGYKAPVCDPVNFPKRIRGPGVPGISASVALARQSDCCVPKNTDTAPDTSLRTPSSPRPEGIVQPYSTGTLQRKTS